MIKTIIISAIVGLLLSVSFIRADESVVNFKDEESLTILNEELRQIRSQLDDHETRLIAGGL